MAAKSSTRDYFFILFWELVFIVASHRWEKDQSRIMHVLQLRRRRRNEQKIINKEKISSGRDYINLCVCPRAVVVKILIPILIVSINTKFQHLFLSQRNKTLEKPITIHSEWRFFFLPLACRRYWPNTCCLIQNKPFFFFFDLIIFCFIISVTPVAFYFRHMNDLDTSRISKWNRSHPTPLLHKHIDFLYHKKNLWIDRVARHRCRRSHRIQ